MAGARSQSGGAADSVFAHCFAVIGDARAAEDAARTAFALAGPWRATLWPHARHQAVRRATEPRRPDDIPLAADVEVGTIATLLAATRPPLERAVLDLRHRTRDGVVFGRALGLPPAAAGERAAGIAEEWDHLLDPALLAFLGPGHCAELAQVLGAPPPAADDDADHGGPPAPERPATVGQLLALAPAVSAHVGNCEACADRMRAMVSVRTLFAAVTGPETPASVRAEARRSRVRRPAGFPPGIEPAPRSRSRRLAPVLAVLATALVVAGAVSVAAIARSGDSGTNDRVAALTRRPAAGTALTVTVSPIARDLASLQITNSSSRAIRWQAGAAADWVVLIPESGVVPPAGTSHVLARLMPDSPEGAVRTTVTVTGNDGSAAAAEVGWSVERPPEVQVSLVACAVRAAIVEAGDVKDVTLHWRNGGEGSAGMAAADEQQWVGQLPASDTPVVWWVTAADDRGNEARTAEQPPVAPRSC